MELIFLGLGRLADVARYTLQTSPLKSQSENAKTCRVFISTYEMHASDSRSSLSTSTAYAMVQALDPDPRIVRYWSIRLGSYALNGGEPIDKAQVARIKARSDAAKLALMNYFRGQQFEPEDGTIAAPADLRLIEGSDEGLRYDATTGAFTVVIPEPPTP